MIYILLIILSTICSSLSYASDLKSRSSSLYPYQSGVEYQDDFLGSIGTGIFGVFNGASANIGGLASRPGILRRDTSAVINTVAGISLGQGGSMLSPSDEHIVLWIQRLNTNDANTTVRIGSYDSPVLNPPVDGIYFEKLDADTNWFCVTRAGGVQTRVDSTVAVTTNFVTFQYTRNSSGVIFKIGSSNVCGTMTTNIPTAGLRPSGQIINSVAASKTYDLDYFQFTSKSSR